MIRLIVVLSGLFLTIVPSGNKIRAQTLSDIEKNIKFNLSVTQNIRIWGAANFVFTEHIIHNTLLINRTQIDRLKGNFQLLSHQHGIVTVLQPRAFFGYGHRIIMPIFHE